MKKAIVFTLMILLGSSVYLIRSGESVPQEEAISAIKVFKTTRDFTVRRIKFPIFGKNEEHWFKFLSFPGPVVQTKVIWHERVGRGSVTDVIVRGNTVRVSGKVQYRLGHSAVLDVRVTVTYLSMPLRVAGDSNGDGAVNIQDLVFIASHFGRTGEHAADVNKDGIVNIQDLVLAANALGGVAAAPNVHVQSLGMLSKKKVQQWLLQAQQLTPMDVRSKRGIAVLEQLLAALTPPKRTVLLSNYPNPFNPETWIPYHLAEPADVTLTIYGIDGKIVRRLDLGHQVAGFYQSRSRAAYWDGRNALGEPVANGVYFYTLKAGDFSATKKMLIRK